MADVNVESSTQNEAVADLILAQGISEPSEAELRGEDVGAEETETEEQVETTEEEPKAEEEKSKEEESETTEEEPASSEPKVEKTPKGFVPLAAVHEARGEIRYLKEQVQELQKALQSQQKSGKQEQPEPLEEFEVLSDDEFEVLAEDNPAQAAIYLRQLNQFEARKREKADLAKQQADFEQAYESIIDSAVAEIEKVAPGIYDEESQVQKDLMEFGESIGFTDDMYYLTNPSTKIILPGETEPLLLGEQAASILGLLVNAKNKTSKSDTSAIEEKLRAEITAEVMAKFKNKPAEHRSLSQVPKTDGDVPKETSFAGKVLTTAQLAKLSPEQYEQYLMGN